MRNIAIFAVVERGKADRLVEEAKKAGALGTTIFYGRGTGENEFKKFFNLQIESSKEIIFILTPEDKKDPIIEALVNAGRLRDPGTGILFTIPVLDILGLHHRETMLGMGHSADEQ
ncbi:MAG: P-II family nitrogen regulator [Firmicutes bacterium]|nr:P-II family nitrogen regulator [Bacillota bacterium]